MPPGARRRVLVTGAGGLLGAAVVSRLDAAPDLGVVIGIDSSAPAVPWARAQFVHADLGHHLLSSIIRAARIDTVIHLGVIHDDLPLRPRSAHESSVLGTVNLLAACSGDGSPVHRVVVRSSAAVYGCGPTDPSLRRETEEPRELGDAVGRDTAEVEGYAREHAVRSPDTALVVLRFGEIVGPGTWMTRALTGPAIPAALGFDPRLQLLHLDDAVSAVLAAAWRGSSATHNVAGDGVVVLSQAASLLGRRLLPVLAPVGAALPITALRRLTGLDLGGQRSALLRHGRVLAIRSLREHLGVRPRTTRATLDSLARSAGCGQPPFAELTEPQLEELLRARATGPAARGR